MYVYYIYICMFYILHTTCYILHVIYCVYIVYNTYNIIYLYVCVILYLYICNKTNKHDMMRQGTSKDSLEFIFCWLSAADHISYP